MEAAHLKSWPVGRWRLKNHKLGSSLGNLVRPSVRIKVKKGCKKVKKYTEHWLRG